MFKLAVIASTLWLCCALVAPAHADCPTDLCDCIGDAGEFSLVAHQAKIRNGTISYSGYGQPVPSFVETSLCGDIGKVGGKVGGETEISEDALFSASAGIAVKFTGSKSYGYAYPGTFIDGDVATGGGSVKNQSLAEISGTVDTAGANPFVSDCRQAQVDIMTGASALKALAPAQRMDELVINDGSEFDINVGSGEPYVIEIGKLIVQPMTIDGYPYGSTLNINLDGINSLVINVTTKLSVGAFSSIVVTGGDVEDVIINVVGSGPSVRIAHDAYVTAPIMAPERKIVASANATASNLFAAKLIVKGTNISETMFCP